MIGFLQGADQYHPHVAILSDERPAGRPDPQPGGRLAELVGGELTVPLVQGGTSRYVDLDLAASAPPMVRVAARVAEVLPFYASVHRGAGYRSLVSTALYEQARSSVHRRIGARDDDVVVFTRNTTDALNLLQRCLPPGEVVFLDVEHHANLLPWQRGAHRCVRAEATFEATLSRLGQELADRPAVLLAVTAASNVTGERLPVARIAALAHAAGCRLAVDAAQLAPHRLIDLAGWDADYVAFSGHKLYAPYGAGVLAGRPDWLDTAPAYLAGGGAVREVSIERTTWAGAPNRQEAGTPNLLGAVALAAAMEVLAELGDEALAAHDRALRSRLLRGLAELPGLAVLRIWPDSDEPVGIVTFTVEGHDSSLVAAVLSAEHGIGVRDGRFCAHPLLARLSGGVGAVRASVGVASTPEDVDALLVALETYLRDGPRWSYEKVAGAFAPVPETRPAPFSAMDLTAIEQAPAPDKQDGPATTEAEPRLRDGRPRRAGSARGR
ncbi:MAG: Selenocysteine lyase [Acidimicrobiaceae bacterium]|nr:Selenocysteine lyase [Acidimicrobiaceae bacterium]